MKNRFYVNDIPGTNQYMEVQFNDMGNVEWIARKDKTTLAQVEHVTYHVNGQPHIVTRDDGSSAWYPMTNLTKNQPFTLR